MTSSAHPDSTADHNSDLAVITGGARGIGRHLAVAFARAGYAVLLSATDADRAHAAAAEVAREAGADSYRVRGAAVDAGDPESVRRFAAEVTAAAAATDTRLRVLINNAGRIESTEGPIWDADPQSIAAVISANVTGPLLLVNALAPVLLQTAADTETPARIIDLNSGSGAQGTNAYAAYSASKLALFRLADSVQHYGYDRGLRIFEMSPGVIRSDMTQSMPVHDDRSEWTDPAEVTDLALALAAGGLDAWSGRYVRAGVDTPASLEARAAAGDLGEGTRRATVQM